MNEEHQASARRNLALLDRFIANVQRPCACGIPVVCRSLLVMSQLCGEAQMNAFASTGTLIIVLGRLYSIPVTCTIDAGVW